MSEPERTALILAMGRHAARLWFAVLATAMLAAPGAATDWEYGPPQFLGEDLVLPGAVAFDSIRERVFVLSTGAHYIAYSDLDDALSGAGWIRIGESANRDDPTALAEPQGIAVDRDGNLYVADTFHNMARLYRFDAATDSYTLDLNFVGSTRTEVEGVPIRLPRDIAAAADGSIYLLDSGNRRILRAVGPDAEMWQVHHTGTDWSEANGLTVSPTGDLYVADTYNHRVVVISAAGAESAFGRFGRERDTFRYPKDVAVDADGRIYVADTHNHRIAIFDDTRNFYRALGRAPLLRNPERLVVSEPRRVFVADIERSDILAFLGPEFPAQFDGGIRDDPGDLGSEPNIGTVDGASPDIVVRASMDVEADRAALEGIEAYGSDAVVPGRDFYIYVEARNWGDRPFPPGGLSLFTSTVDGVERDSRFPEGWLSRETFEAAPRTMTGAPSYRLAFPGIPASSADGPGRTVVGPLLWRPASTTTTCEQDERLFVMARLASLDDPTRTEVADGFAQAMASNNVAISAVPFVAASCLPESDRYERNETVAEIADVHEAWDHLSPMRCPRTITRALGTTYPDTNCDGVFEDVIAPREAEKIWTLEIDELSLHSQRDKDFFEIPLPDFTDPDYGVADINTEDVRQRFGNLENYVPDVMPECGSVQREEIGPEGADRTIFVTVATKLVVEAIPEGPRDSAIAPRPIAAGEEAVHIYDAPAPDGSRDRDPPYVTATSPLRKVIDCPRSDHGLDAIGISVGERESERALLQGTGGYRLSLSYVSSIQRSRPVWAEDPGITGGVGRLDCVGTSPLTVEPGAATAPFRFPLFPFCGRIGAGHAAFFDRHPVIPGLFDCIADGPGCFSVHYFNWPSDGIPFEARVLATEPIFISLVDARGESIDAVALAAERREAIEEYFQSAGVIPDERFEFGGVIAADILSPGFNALRISGPPSEFALTFEPPATAASSTPIISIADFTVVPSYTQPGADVQVSFRLENKGGVASDEDFMVDAVLSTDDQVPRGFARYAPEFHEDVLLRGGRFSVGTVILPGGEIALSDSNNTLPFDLEEGQYFICIRVDPGGVLPELDDAEGVACTRVLVRNS